MGVLVATLLQGLVAVLAAAAAVLAAHSGVLAAPISGAMYKPAPQPV